MSHRQISVTCTGEDCSESIRVKTVGLVHLGQDVYIQTALVCGVCGGLMKQINE